MLVSLLSCEPDTFIRLIALFSATHMTRMFQDADAFTGGDLSGWADCVYALEDASQAFRATKFTGSVAGWQLYSLTNMFEMFYQCYGCKPDVGDWWVGDGVVEFVGVVVGD